MFSVAVRIAFVHGPLIQCKEIHMSPIQYSTISKSGRVVSSLLISFLISICLLAINVQGQQRKSESSHKAAPAREVKQYTIEQFMNTVRIGGSSFSSDEQSVLFHNNKSGIFNVYSVPVAGGQPTQLTNSVKESTYAVSYFPADSRILYTYDRGGNENSHLYLRELDGTARSDTGR